MQSSTLLHLESCLDGREGFCVTSASEDFFSRQLDERIGYRSRWQQQTHPTNPTTTKNPIIKNGETRWWTRVHQGGGARAREKDRMSSSSRSTSSRLAAGLQPFSNNSKAMIRGLGSVELFELCETFPKVQCSHCLFFFLESRKCLLHLRTILG